MANKDTLNAFYESSSNTDLNIKIAKSIGWLNSTLAKALKAKKSSAVKVGKMYTFAYEPIGQDRLPYWDRFPLVIVLEIRKHTIVGINVHYIPMKDRIKIFKKLLNSASTAGLSSRSKLNDAFSDIKKVNRYNYMVKQYHGSGVRSNIYEIPGNEWGQAVTLPYSNFVIGEGDQSRMGPTTKDMLKETMAMAKKMTQAAAQEIKE